MFRMPSAGRLALAVAAAGAIALATAVPASAHNEVSASEARALATDVTLTFEAAAESKTAGITSLRVVLPQGIVPGDVSYVEGPSGWAFKPGEDGYTVGGTALAPGADAEYKVKVRQLPNADVLVFKTLQEYSDGRIDRWIDPPKTGDDHSDAAAKPAPSLALQKSAPGATVIPPTPTAGTTAGATPSTDAPTGAPSSSPAATPSQPAAAPTNASGGVGTPATEDDEDDSSALPVILGVVVGVVVVGAAGIWWWRRRTPQV